MRLDQMAAPAFVVLWSTGFIAAKLGLPYAEPMGLLALRFGLAALVLAGWVVLSGARWPSWRQVGQQSLTGILVHGLYLGGVFVAIFWGLEAGVSSMIVSLQPIMTALLAVWILGERVRPVQWAGMALGFGGVVLVVARKLDAGIGEPWGVAFCAAGLLAISVGSVLQKQQSEDVPMRAGNAVQFAAAAVFCLLCAAVFETGRLEWEAPLILALGWQVLVLSIGAITLLYIMIRHGAASQVASLFFLVPPCTALMAWAIFGETLGTIELAGLAATALGVLMVIRPDLLGRKA